jgi:hypothetical protein
MATWLSSVESRPKSASTRQCEWLAMRDLRCESPRKLIPVTGHTSSRKSAHSSSPYRTWSSSARSEPVGRVHDRGSSLRDPVVARRRGLVPEILRDGVTGPLCQTEAEMVNAAARLPEISRRRCREAFEARFSDQSWQSATPTFTGDGSPRSAHTCGYRPDLDLRSAV